MSTAIESDAEFVRRAGITGVKVELGIPIARFFAAGDMPPASAVVHVSRLVSPSPSEREEIRAWAADKLRLPPNRVQVGD